MTVTRREYRPGSGWTLLARGELTVLVPAAQSDEFLGRLWDALGADGADLYALLDVFASAFGLARMPAFALAEHGDRLRLLVRGAVRATVTTASGDEALSGSEVGTWLERAFEAWDAVEVSGAPAGAVAGEEPRGALPLLGGVVAADTLLVAADRGMPAAEADDAASAARAVSSPAAVVPPDAVAPVTAPVTAAVPAAASEETLLPESTVGGSTLAGPATDDPAQAHEAPADEAQPDEAAAGPAPVVAEEASEATTSTSDYDHLWGTTVLRSVEDAAVRTDGEEDEEPSALEPSALEPSAPEPSAPEPSAPEPGAQESSAGESSATEPDASAPDARELGARGPEADAAGGHALSDTGNGRGPAAWSPPSLLIDAVPWAKPQQAPPAHASAHEPGEQHQPRPRPRAQSEMHYPDAPRDGAGPGTGPQGRSITSELYGDHDGETVMRSELDPASLGAEPDQGPAASGAPGAAREAAAALLVLGRRCPQGHASPPSYPQCAVCGEHLDGETVQVPRPALGRVVFSTGEVIDLVQPLVVGRQPSVSRVPSGGMPRLVSVTSPSGDISRNHLEVRLEGWHVMVRDLKATNGTVLARAGQAPRRLAQGEMTIVLDGDVADLGDGVSLRFEAVP
ncbi:FHA domain containing protein [Sinomonas atrocyanea]|uniref:FHA domain containing protein n=1 Tax=Sinomonas atrocyanea TaxID=37927 RepID=A0A126ZYH5_9MICC|nr:FHA domain containing protein [Sinomonas atrocyanea]GEB64659.1 hypothetical protein SAT01_21070 [Sinomonas atrocyanea]GGG82334.1 hypothetical protein GCM10007172_39860 [Sinomonas atrocyanea]